MSTQLSTRPPLQRMMLLHRHLQRYRKLVQRTGGYAVDRPLVLLELLERDVECVGNHLLVQPRFPPPQAQARSNDGTGEQRAKSRPWAINLLGKVLQTAPVPGATQEPRQQTI